MFKSNNKIKLALAPMAGITDKAFRQICAEAGADITWSEMVSAEGLIRQKNTPQNKSLALAEKFGKTEEKYWVQIFGNNPVSMARAAKIIEKKISPSGIDINLGCPVKKAQKSGYGAIQIKNIPQVIKIIKEIKKEISIPLSLKTRLGLTNSQEILNFAPLLENAGLDQIVVHARTLKGMFQEIPQWEVVKELSAILKIPVIYNGGVKTAEDIKFYAQKTGCQTLMIGQAAIGNPWIFRTQQQNSYNLTKTILRHAKLAQGYYGKQGLITFRTHFSAYLKGYPNAKKLRHQAVQIKTISDIKQVLEILK